MRQRFLFAAILGLALVLSATPPVAAQDKFELKLGHYVPAGHFFSRYLENWANVFASSRMAASTSPSSRAPRWVLPRATTTWRHRRGRHRLGPARRDTGAFSARRADQPAVPRRQRRIGAKVPNDPAVRARLEPEHEGVKALYLSTHQPGNLHTREKPVRSPADLQGMRVRFAAATIREYLAALGATPVGVPPPEIAEALQKGTIDGVLIDYGGAHTAFKLGGLVDYTTELYAYVTSFAVVMNAESFERLPDDLQALIEETTTGVAEEIGKLWDAADAPGRAYLQAEGGEAIVPPPEEAAAFHEVGAEVTEKVVADLTAQGLPAREVYELMRERSDHYAQTLFSFLE